MRWSTGPLLAGRKEGGEGRAYSPSPPQLWGAPALRSTAEDKGDKGAVGWSSLGNLPHHTAAPARALPEHSCPGLAHQGCPGLLSPLSPGGRLGGPSGPAHSPRRCSEETMRKVGGPGSEPARMGQMGSSAQNPGPGHPAQQRSAHTVSLPATSLRQLRSILRGPDPNNRL